jgi:hypothetical protein
MGWQGNFRGAGCPGGLGEQGTAALPGLRTHKGEMKMKEEKFRKKILKLGGKISPLQVVNFPDSFRINNKGEAIDVLDILTLEQTAYAMNVEVPLKALKAAIKKGVL